MSNLLRKIKFILQFDIDFQYIVYDFSSQSAVRFLDYDKALEFSESQFEYKPQVMVGIYKS